MDSVVMDVVCALSPKKKMSTPFTITLFFCLFYTCMRLQLGTVIQRLKIKQGLSKSAFVCILPGYQFVLILMTTFFVLCIHVKVISNMEVSIEFSLVKCLTHNLVSTTFSVAHRRCHATVRADFAPISTPDPPDFCCCLYLLTLIIGCNIEGVKLCYLLYTCVRR